MLVLKYLKTNEEFSSESQAADTYMYIEIRCRPRITLTTGNVKRALLLMLWAARHKNTSPFSGFVIRPYNAYQKK